MTILTIPQISAHIDALSKKIGLLSQIFNSTNLAEITILCHGDIDNTKFSNLADISDSDELFRSFLNDYIPVLIAEKHSLEMQLEKRMVATL